jgi:hypothetical protein
MPTQLFSYAVALIILNIAALCLGVWALPFLAISFLNAGLIALASNGGFEAASKLFGK